MKVILIVYYDLYQFCCVKITSFLTVFVVVFILLVCFSFQLAEVKRVLNPVSC